MGRTLVLLAIGIAVGAGGTYYLVSPTRPAVSVQPVAPAPATPSSAPAAVQTLDIADAPSISERSVVYGLAAQADADDLESLIADTAARPASAMRRFTLGVLLARYAEIDAGRAVRVARELDLDAALLADAIVATAETSPAQALEQAVALDDRRARLLAVQRVAQLWAAFDPRAALAGVADIDDTQAKAAFENSVLAEWVRTDPEASLAYVNALDGTAQQRLLRIVMPQIAQTDPERLLEITDRLSGITSRFARLQALQQLAQRDPAAALAELARLPPGQERQQFLQTVAGAYGAAQPDDALAWARSLQPPQPGVLSAVLGGIAQTDVDRAFELALNETSPGERQRAVQMIVMRGASAGSENVARMAERVLALSDSSIRQSALQMLTSYWANNAPREAIEWLLVNSERVGPNAFRNVAQQLGQQEPAVAALYTARIPQEARTAWIAQVAQGYARVDAQGALSWIAQFRGETGYAAGVAAIAQTSARYDPQTAARLLDGIDAPSTDVRGTVLMVAGQ
jgi:hypothetical protein